MNILFTLCGRAGSKGFPNKNTKSFLGIPLLYYSLAAIELFMEKQSSQYCIDIALNTDSAVLAEISKKQTRIPLYLLAREPDLAGDSVAKVAVIKDSLNKMEHLTQKNYEMVVDLDLTSPIRTVENIEEAVLRKKKREDVDVVFSVTDARRNPYFNMVKKENEYFCRALKSPYVSRQQAPLYYDMNASIYVYSIEALKNKSEVDFYNDKCDAIMMRDTGILDIDSEEDFELMQVIAKYLVGADMGFCAIYTKAKEYME